MSEFTDYLEFYCKSYGFTVEEALEHKIVAMVAYHYGVNIDDYKREVKGIR